MLQFNISSIPPQSLLRSTRAGLRSGPAIEITETNDPESILRNRRKTRTTKGIEQPQLLPQADLLTRSNLERLNAASQIGSSPSEEHLDEETLRIKETYPGIEFDFEWGYLPPLDEDTLGILGVLFADQPAMSEALKKVSKPQFEIGLGSRNVDLDESESLDPCQEEILQLLSGDQAWETEEERIAYETLWALDEANCLGQSNEAIFQRTVMMSLVARHCLIYKRNASRPRILEISVEESWTCPPAPSRAFIEGEGSLLTKPKPDLAISFSREKLLSRLAWVSLPVATQSLASYENLRQPARRKVFHFLTIEAKKGMTSTDDSKALLQSLNNASQSLYNMYEFFREAGSEHEEKFFKEVRFFSVVASTEGLTFRIHRATRVTDKADLVTDGYPLQFVYRVFKRLQVRIDYNRDTVLDIFKHILVGYAEEKLFKLLKAAAEAIREKFMKDPGAKNLRQTIGYDFYGDSKPSKKSNRKSQGSKSTYVRGSTMLVDGRPDGSIKDPIQSSANSAHDLSMRSGTATPKVSHIKQGRRRRSRSDDRPSRSSDDSEGPGPKRQKQYRRLQR